MALYRVHLLVARSDEYPEGSDKHGYDFILPLDKDMQLDPDAWQNHKDDCIVRRFAEDEDDMRGRLRHIGRGWVFDYDPDSTDDNEPLFKLDRHKLDTGEYVSITEHDGEMRTFKVVAVHPYP